MTAIPLPILVASGLLCFVVGACVGSWVTALLMKRWLNRLFDSRITPHAP